MLKQLVCTVLASLLVMSLNGCLVAESTYLKKAEEVDNLTKNLGALQQRHEKLASDNSTLKAQFNKLKAEAAGLTKGEQALTADNKQLEDMLKAKSDTFSKSITELRQKISDLEKENSRLKEYVTVLGKVREEKVKEVSKTYEQLLSNMKNEIAQGVLTISELKGKLTVNMDATTLFDSGKAGLKLEGISILNKMIATLKGVTDKAIRIEGHTDNVQISGGLTREFPTNWELSAARAVNVTKFLQQQGLNPAFLSAAAFAENKPVADNSAKEGRAKNRRIEITLVDRD